MTTLTLTVPTVNVPGAPDLSRTSVRSSQLLAASARSELDPPVVDWAIPMDDHSFHVPPEWLPLFATAAWDAMSGAEQRTYSRHEAAVLCGASAWFEHMLMRTVIKHVGELDVTDPVRLYLLTEVADECRHSIMFGRWVTRAGTPAYQPRQQVPFPGTKESEGGRMMAYLLILAVEEMIDAVNRATVKDERVHELARQVARVHVVEEARHVSFAKTYMTEAWPQLPESTRAAVIEHGAAAVADVADLMVEPAVYEHLGIEDGLAQVLANPARRRQRIDGLSRLTSFLDALGVITDETRHRWVERDLIGA